MLGLSTANTPSGRKAAIMRQATNLPYTACKIDLSDGFQGSAEFRRLAPNGSIPVPIGRDNANMIPESRRLLVYLAEETDRLLSQHQPARHRVGQWLFFQIGDPGPIMGQLNHFRRNPGKNIAHAIERFENKACQLFDVLVLRLADRESLARE